MSVKKKINYYVVPIIKDLNSGPGVRIESLRNLLKSDTRFDVNEISNKDKILNTLNSELDTITYIESSTNRLSIIDVFCLTYLRYFKRSELNVYIRDIYTIVYPESYSGLRKRITYIANLVTLRFYHRICENLFFPTKQMSKVFYEFLGVEHDNHISFPPGSSENQLRLSSYNSNLILHVGGLEYVNSGLDDLFYVVRKLPNDFKLVLITRDIELVKSHLSYEESKDKIILKSMNKSEWVHYIERNKVLCAIHSRPRNEYDDMTFPIKILDYISYNIPFISLKHKPLVEMLGDNSTLVVDDFKDTGKIISRLHSDEVFYNKCVKEIKETADKFTYKNNFDRAFNFDK